MHTKEIIDLPEKIGLVSRAELVSAKEVSQPTDAAEQNTKTLLLLLLTTCLKRCIRNGPFNEMDLSILSAALSRAQVRHSYILANLEILCFKRPDFTFHAKNQGVASNTYSGDRLEKSNWLAGLRANSQSLHFI